jgi:hypothetical protein
MLLFSTATSRFRRHLMRCHHPPNAWAIRRRRRRRRRRRAASAGHSVVRLNPLSPTAYAPPAARGCLGILKRPPPRAFFYSTHSTPLVDCSSVSSPRRSAWHSPLPTDRDTVVKAVSADAVAAGAKDQKISPPDGRNMCHWPVESAPSVYDRDRDDEGEIEATNDVPTDAKLSPPKPIR